MAIDYDEGGSPNWTRCRYHPGRSWVPVRFKRRPGPEGIRYGLSLDPPVWFDGAGSFWSGSGFGR
jgi:hypothetical protein